jgi:hypothetical protein
MTSYIRAKLRRSVIERAHGVCEYCRIREVDTYLGCQIDHIVGEKHGGGTVASNLAYACTFRNRFKGSDIGSTDETGLFVRFFNPRTDVWSDHFEIRGDVIEPKTNIGSVTARLLGFNSTERRIERQALILIGRYPPQESTTDSKQTED